MTDDGKTSEPAHPNDYVLGVADAKRRFAELLDRVHDGERFLISRRGRPAAAVVPPEVEPVARRTAPVRKSLAEFAGILGEAEGAELDALVEEAYAARTQSQDRPPPQLH